MENSFREDSNVLKIQVDDMSRAHMLETARWTKFIGIVNIIFLCLYLLFMMFTGAAFSTLPSSYGGSAVLAGMGTAGVIFMAVIIVALVIYPIISLMRYSKNMKAALYSSNQVQFNEATGNMKSFFKYIGVVMIIVLGLYAVMFLFILLGALMT